MQAVLTDSKISGGLYEALGVSVGGLKKTITQEMSRGIASGLFWRDIARNISNVSGSGYSNARRIVVTEGNRIQNTASRNAALDAKAHGADLVKIWDSTLDGKTRESHRIVDGEIRELDEKFSNGLDRPGDSSAPASEVVNCRCKEIHKPRWDAKGGFLKVDNFTGEVMSFNSPKDYAEFKERYWSQENIEYMNHVSRMETKYGTKNFETVLDSMTDEEYHSTQILEGNNQMFKISAPIDSRSDPYGNPRAVSMFDVPLTKQQESLLESLQKADDVVVVSKRDVRMLDLAAMTAKTGCEFAMFTKSGERMVIRGDTASVNVTVDKALELKDNGYKWSGHTHPGTDRNSLMASDGDYEILKSFGQVRNVIYNSFGQYMVFELE